MTVTVSSMGAMFPELASDARLQSFIDQAGRRMDRSKFDNLADDAQSYLAAHLLTMAMRRGGATGAVVAERAGPFAQEYAQLAGARNLRATPYGVEYLNLVRLRGLTPVVG